jgi:hypothetical protein
LLPACLHLVCLVRAQQATPLSRLLQGWQVSGSMVALPQSSHNTTVAKLAQDTIKFDMIAGVASLS